MHLDARLLHTMVLLARSGERATLPTLAARAGAPLGDVLIALERLSAGGLARLHEGAPAPTLAGLAIGAAAGALTGERAVAERGRKKLRAA